MEHTFYLSMNNDSSAPLRDHLAGIR
jgi:hypothetical protein